jgi:glycosyltransferase involved in cell wall biosynthesis
MKILFCYAPYMFRYPGYFEQGKRFDFPRLFDDPAGLTGSELSCFMLAQHMAKRTHEVSLLTTLGPNRIESWNGVRIIPMDSRNDIGVLGGDWDAVCSWNDLDSLMYVSNPKAIRMINLQINDVHHGAPGFDQHIDVYTSPSESHRKTVGIKTPDFSKWEVLTNGCSPSAYGRYEHTNPIVQGRVIYASSPDRGLHWLLQIWPKVRKAVPHAHLKIFYEMKRWMDPLVNEENNPIRDIAVLANRARYIREALRRLEGQGIEVVGSVSRNRIAQEFSEAQVLAYPCDTINYTEGFSVTLMEACASHTVPVTTSVDALGELYGDAVPMVQAPVGDRLEEYIDLVIRSLTDELFRTRVLQKIAKLSRAYDWRHIASNLEAILKRRQK